MKKLICVIPITILICILLSKQEVYAYEYVSDVPNIAIVHCETGWYAVCSDIYHGDTYPRFNPIDNSITFDGCAPNKKAGYNGMNNAQAAINYITSQGYLSTVYGSFTVDTVIIYKGTCHIFNNMSTDKVFGSLEEYNQSLITPTPTPTSTPTPTPAPAWYQEMWDTLSDELGKPEFWFGEWFIDIIDQVFNNEDEPSQGPSGLSHSTHINQVTPAPTPTPIPYSTITVPRTDIINNTTVYETQYVYTSSSGDTIIATSPPINTPSQNPSGGGGGGGSDYNPIDPYSIPEVSWFTSAEIGDTSYDGIDSIMQGFDSIDTIGEEYKEGMSTAEDSMGLLPTSWLLLIGVAAAIPLIAGIISRFLS